MPEVDLYRYPMHGDDLQHIFKAILHKNFTEMSPEGYKTIQLMISAWTNFAANGDPSIPEMNIRWPAVTSESEMLMGLNINENVSEVMIFPLSDRMKVYDEIWEMDRGGSISLTVLKSCL